MWSETDPPIATAARRGPDVVDFKSQVADFESGLLKQALCDHGNNQTEAAKALHLNYHQFRRLLDKHGLLPGK